VPADEAAKKPEELFGILAGSSLDLSKFLAYFSAGYPKVIIPLKI